MRRNLFFANFTKSLRDSASCAASRFAKERYIRNVRSDFLAKGCSDSCLLHFLRSGLKAAESLRWGFLFLSARTSCKNCFLRALFFCDSKVRGRPRFSGSASLNPGMKSRVRW